MWDREISRSRASGDFGAVTPLAAATASSRLMTIVSSWWLRGCFLTHGLYPLDAPARVHRALRQGVLNQDGPCRVVAVAIAGDVAGAGPRVFGDDLDGDRSIVDLNGTEARTSQTEQKVDSMRLTLEAAILHGDANFDPRAFNGLSKRLVPGGGPGRQRSGRARLWQAGKTTSFYCCSFGDELMTGLQGPFEGRYGIWVRDFGTGRRGVPHPGGLVRGLCRLR